MSAEPRFMFVAEQDLRDPATLATFYTLSEQVAANKDDPDYCAWLRDAQPGEHYISGGGAAACFMTWRVA